MANLSPLSRRELVRKLKALGFEGPFAVKATVDAPERFVRYPNPHGVRSIPRSFGESCDTQVSRLMNG
jgi:hypothetical protein